MAFAENTLEMQNSDRFKRGPGKPRKMGIWGKIENMVSVKNKTQKSLPLYCSALSGTIEDTHQFKM